jgi:hypothetical protein
MHPLKIAIVLAPLCSLPQGRPAPPAAAPADPELPALRLPRSAQAGAPLEGDVAVLHVLPDGRVVAAAGELFDPAAPDEEQALAPLRRWLADVAGGMEKEPIAEGQSLLLPAEPLLLRVDAFAAFEHVQRVMEQCGRRDAMIWRIELAAAPHASDAPHPYLRTRELGAPLHAHLPMDAGIHQSEPQEKVEVRLRVVDPGEKVAGEDGAFTYGDGRSLHYEIGPVRCTTVAEVGDRVRKLGMAHHFDKLVIDARSGVTHGEVVAVMNAALDAGYESITFVGRGL